MPSFCSHDKLDALRFLIVHLFSLKNQGRDTWRIPVKTWQAKMANSTGRAQRDPDRGTAVSLQAVQRRINLSWAVLRQTRNTVLTLFNYLYFVAILKKQVLKTHPWNCVGWTPDTAVKMNHLVTVPELVAKAARIPELGTCLLPLSSKTWDALQSIGFPASLGCALRCTPWPQFAFRPPQSPGSFTCLSFSSHCLWSGDVCGSSRLVKQGKQGKQGNSSAQWEPRRGQGTIGANASQVPAKAPWQVWSKEDGFCSYEASNWNHSSIQSSGRGRL